MPMDLRITKHAKERMEKYGISESLVHDAMESIKGKKHDLENRLNRLREEVIYEDYEKPF